MPEPPQSKEVALWDLQLISCAIFWRTAFTLGHWLAPKKKPAQFAGLPIEIVIGDVTNVSGFAPHLHGVEVLFHTAAYFRESFEGGSHRDELFRVNVEGTRDLLSHAYSAGVRRFVHTSSGAVLAGKPGQLIDETMSRPVDEASDYPRSKIQADQEVAAFLRNHPDASGCTVLPGWMFGPGDIGPTSSGQLILDFLHSKLPGIPPAEFTVVDTRDVAEAHVVAALQGRRGERYLMAGRCMEMAELFAVLEETTGVPAPARNIPIAFLYGFAAVNEAWHFLSKSRLRICLRCHAWHSPLEPCRLKHLGNQRRVGVARANGACHSVVAHLVIYRRAEQDDASGAD